MPSPPVADAAPPGPPGFFEPGQSSGLFEPAVANAASYEPDEQGYPAEETAVVRPYALTGGRTKANLTLELETLISVSDGAALRDLSTVQYEHRSIMEECRTPRSVAEIAALLRVPLGVARVLISDAADAGLITVHKTVSGKEDAEAHFMLMPRNDCEMLCANWTSFVWLALTSPRQRIPWMYPSDSAVGAISSRTKRS